MHVRSRYGVQQRNQHEVSLCPKCVAPKIVLRLLEWKGGREIIGGCGPRTIYDAWSDTHGQPRQRPKSPIVRGATPGVATATSYRPGAVPASRLRASIIGGILKLRV